MRKRFWVVGAILVYAIIRGLGGGGGESAGVVMPSATHEQSKAKPSPSRAVGLPQGNTDPRPSAKSPDSAQNPQGKIPARSITVLFVKANRVAFRSEPSTTGSIIDRLDSGRKVLLMEQSGDWSHIRDELTQREGWMSSRFLEEKRKSTEEKSSASTERKNNAEKPTLVILTP